MARATVIGIQVPPDSIGKITGAFKITDPDGNVDSNNNLEIIYLPATAIVDADGSEIGSDLLEQLTRIADSLDELKLSMKIQTDLIGG